MNHIFNNLDTDAIFNNELPSFMGDICQYPAWFSILFCTLDACFSSKIIKNTSARYTAPRGDMFLHSMAQMRKLIKEAD